jgi:hypothetical protein
MIGFMTNLLMIERMFVGKPSSDIIIYFGLAKISKATNARN